MTQEEKAKRYDEAIKVAKSNYETIVQMDNDCTFAKEGIVNTFHHMFPELKESEDERIRKALIRFHKSTIDIDGIKGADVIAWLEKQGEQKGMNIVEEDMTPFQKKVFCIIDTTIEEEQGLKQVCDELLRLAHDEIIQKPAWSEEDEQYLLVCKNALAKYQTTDKWDAHIISYWLENKLKSLKPQNRWKPSDEQMAALSDINCTGYISYAGQGQELINLYNGLKKLKS